MEIPKILRMEAARSSMLHVITAGLPTVVAYHVFDWIAVVAESLLDTILDEDEQELSQLQTKSKRLLQGV